MKYPNSSEVLVLITNNKFRPFDKYDHMAFNGAITDNPLICETDEYILIIDGHIINMLYHDDEFGGQLYSLIEGL